MSEKNGLFKVSRLNTNIDRKIRIIPFCWILHAALQEVRTGESVLDLSIPREICK